MSPPSFLTMADIISSAGSVVNGALGLIGASQQRKWEEKQQEKQQVWNEQMMDKQNQFNVNMWNMQNAYNDPSEQYKRLLASGFNPMYYGPDGSGNSESVSSAQALGYERASNVQNPLLAGVQSYLQSMQIQAQAKANVASAKKNEADADYTTARTITENLMRGVNFELAGLDIDLKSSNIRLNESEAEKNSAEIVRINKECIEIDTKIQESLVNMDVKQRSQSLQEMAFAFEKEIRSSELSLSEQRVAIQWYNANINKVLADSQVEVNKQHNIYLDLEGEHIKAVTQTENDSRTFVVEGYKWDASNARRNYKWSPVNNTVKAVGTAVAAAGVAVSSVLKAVSPTTVAKPSGVAGESYIDSPMFYQ